MASKLYVGGLSYSTTSKLTVNLSTPKAPGSGGGPRGGGGRPGGRPGGGGGRGGGFGGGDRGAYGVPPSKKPFKW